MNHHSHIIMHSMLEAVTRHLTVVYPWGEPATALYPSPTAAPTLYDPFDYVNQNASWSASSSSHSSGGGDDKDDVYKMPWYYTLLFMTAFILIVCGAYLLRWTLWKLLGWECCRLDQRHRGQHSYFGNQYARNPALFRGTAGTRGGYLDEDLREQQLAKQRQERRLWYTYYLKPFVTVLSEEHFDIPDNDPILITMEEGTHAPRNNATEDTDCNEGSAVVALSTIDESSKDAPQQQGTPIEPPINNNPDVTTRYMQLWDKHDRTYRCLEANCSICLGDYDIGDEVVQSAATEEEEHCRHVFHVECLLQWLSQGKKRCPICRHWFVPATRIKSQMKHAHVVTHDTSLHHLYDTRSRQPVVSLHDDDSGEDDDSNSGPLSPIYPVAIDMDDATQASSTRVSSGIIMSSSPNEANVDNDDSPPTGMEQIAEQDFSV